MADRVVVFLDYQNVYSTARRAFHGRNAPPSAGQIDPARLAKHLARNSTSPRHLLQVRIYRSEPSPRFDQVGNAAWHRQVAAWTAGRRGNGRLTLPAKKLYCHWLRAQTYRLMQDLTAYARSSVRG
jgi:hypothetical protein